MPKIGTPHFKNHLRQIRGSGYTFERCINDIIDNVINKAVNLEINLIFNDNNKLTRISFSDDYINGFENIENDNANNPLNIAHSRIEHINEDNDLSEFGIGLKASAMNLGEMLIIFSKVKNKYYNIELDFAEMSSKKKAEDSNEPTLFDNKTSIETYKKKHPFEYGSTIIIQNIRDEIISSINDNNCLIEYLKNNLSETFGRTEINIKINNQPINMPCDYLKNNEKKFFNKYSKVYVNFNIEPNYIIKICYKNKDTYYDKNFNKITNYNNFIKNSKILILQFSSTFTYFYFYKTFLN